MQRTLVFTPITPLLFNLQHFKYSGVYARNVQFPASGNPARRVGWAVIIFGSTCTSTDLVFGQGEEKAE